MVPKPMVFELGSAVEVSIYDGSWFSGTIIGCDNSDRFLVQYHCNSVEIAVVSLHHLRPLPPPNSHQEFKSGDKVEVFHDHCWREGHITGDLVNGRFVVSFRYSKEMTFPKEQLREHRQWINDNWVSSNRDRISELPDNVLLHIMNFVDTKDAVKTCVLSKRWKDLGKGLVKLTFSPNLFELGLVGTVESADLLKVNGLVESFKKFASWVFSSRDDSCSLLNLTIRHTWTEPEHLDRIIKYAVFHNVQHLTLRIYSGFRPNFESIPLIFSSKSLTYLEIWNGCDLPEIILPKSLNLPALKSLKIGYFKFTATENDCAEPFSNCLVLNSLMLIGCSLHDDAQVLRISNSTLSRLTIFGGKTYQIVLSTPNLSSFTILDSTVSHQLFSTCNLPFLGEVNIDMYRDGGSDEGWDEKSSIIMKWLHVLANVKMLTLYPRAFEIILRELSNPISLRPQPPSFVRLESLTVNTRLYANISDEVLISTLLGYLLQNSPMDKLDIINV
ncbi:hypothetical protein JHK87_045529 [Glycine soja]|nr:hypothetical protein JHK87_045529 [Glycine soja]